MNSFRLLQAAALFPAVLCACFFADAQENPQRRSGPFAEAEGFAQRQGAMPAPGIDGGLGRKRQLFRAAAQGGESGSQLDGHQR